LPDTLEPRSLAVCGGEGLTISGGHGEARLEPARVPLVCKYPPIAEGEPPRTPTHQKPLPVAPHTPGDSTPSGVSGGLSTRTLVVGKNSVYAICPLTLVAQADALLDKDRVDDAVGLAEQIDVDGVERVCAAPWLNLLCFGVTFCLPF
jgi:hypothetical protein